MAVGKTAEKVICLAGQKGGVGKTTIAVTLACELHQRGQRVALFDADPQGSVSTFAQVAAEAGEACPDVFPMATNTLHLADNKDVVRAKKLYDFIFIDCPPAHNDIQTSALLASDLAIFPCGPGSPEVWGMDRTADHLRRTREALKRARALRPELDAVMVLTKLVHRTAIATQAKNTFAAFDIPLLETSLTFLVAYQEFFAAGKGVGLYVPGTTAALEVSALANEILERLQHAP